MKAPTSHSSGEGEVSTAERRRYPRADVACDIILANDNGSRWRGQTVDLNQYGVRVRFERDEPGPPAGTIVQLQLALPDAKPPLSLKGIVWRVAAQGTVVVFSNLATNEFSRLRELTDNLLGNAR